MGEKAMVEQEQLPGYIRCNAMHISLEWKFEVVSERPRVSVATIETDDGPLHIGLNREDAVRLQQRLQLFLQDWPEGQLNA
jgi:hypothetical protein